MNANRLHLCFQLVKHFGPKWLMYRVYHAARLKSGLIRRRLPVTRWDEQPLARFLRNRSLTDQESYAEYRRFSAPPFFIDPVRRGEFQSGLAAWDVDDMTPLSEANDVAQGYVKLFSHERVNVGFPPNWHSNPFSSLQFPANAHWSDIGDFSTGDIKLVWETNRFGFVFSLVRSYWRTGDECYAETFWQLIENWYESNAPESGVNWKCGQEISLRVMAWCFGLYGFGASPASTPARVTKLAQMIAVSGQRIEFNIGYGLSQQNNHGLSEAMGLWTIGSLFPEFTDSARWMAAGRRLLERQAREVIYDDGAFSQHSMNYHRVMLHDYLWSIRLGDVLDHPFSNQLRERIAKAGEFVFQLQDESTGRVPCYGQDDGALILPLNNCGYRDYRPVVQAVHFLTTGERKFESGPWDEDLFWMFGEIVPDERQEHPGQNHDDEVAEWRQTVPAKSPAKVSRRDFDAADGGYATLRSIDGFAAVRAAKFRHRPSQADMLNVDIWWHGENIAVDPGTYSYNAPSPWNNPFAHTAQHNTVVVDGRDQMEAASRFLWLPWVTGQSFGRDVPCRGDVSCWNGEHDGYCRLADRVIHRRGLVRLGADHWLIVDSLFGRKSHSYRLHWLLLDAPFDVNQATRSIALQTAAGPYRLAASSTEAKSKFSVTRAANDSTRGWRSTHYHSREPALSVTLEANAPAIVFATLLGPDACEPMIQHNRVIAQGSDWEAVVTLNNIERFGIPLISSVVASGHLAKSDLSTSSDSSRQQPEFVQCTSC